ncbi:MAG: hypothetical protein ABI678_04065 [Kofleriaceae bacterium]
MKTAIVLLLALARTASANGDAGGIDASDLSGNGMYPDGTRLSEFTNNMSDLSGQMSDIAGGVSNGLNVIGQLTETFTALTDLDQTLHDTIRDDHSGPEVPTGCGTGSARESCSECYTHAYNEINFVRNTLNRLRTILSRTLNYIRNAEGLGDSVSGIHGVSGLSWQYAKGGIEQTKAHLLQTSTAKYQALVQSMRHALDMVATCERTYFNNPDWYNRYGFMYYNFIKEAYAIHE